MEHLTLRLNGSIALLISMCAMSVYADQTTIYTYTPSGKIHTIDGPRQDVQDITVYEYDTNNNLASITDAAGHTSYFNLYDLFGRLLSETDSNGVVSEFTYYDRGWLKSSKIKHPSDASLDKITTYGYDAVGNLTSMTLPNGYQLGYEYDDARRLTAIKTPAGERVEYQLDLAGNRTQQAIKNSSGIITYSLARAYDELSRVMKETGNHSQVQQFEYDANDNPKLKIDGRSNKTEQNFDALNRVYKIIDPALGNTSFTYDGQNHIKTATDALDHTTTYNYDGYGNLLSQTSPDTGTTTYEYDPAGNRTRVTDARGVVVNYAYDALNRLTSVTYPGATAENVTYTYDSTAGGSYGIGRLASVSNASSAITYSYNYLGLISQKQTTLNGGLFTTQYRYDTSGNLTGITYPSGRVLTYMRDAAGRVQSIATQDNATALSQPVVSNISYLPFGPANTYTFGNGLTHNITYDNDYRPTAIQVGTVLSRSYSYDPADNIVGILNLLSVSKSQTFDYDASNRLTSAYGVYGSQSFTYDAVGNRKTQVSNPITGLVNEAYSYAANNNQLTGITKTGAATGTRSFTYDVAGNRSQGTAEDASVQTYTYNKANRLTSVKVGATVMGTYTYNALGPRVSKAAGGVKEFYHYDEAGQLIAVTDAANKFQREYLYNGSQLVSYVTVANPAIPSLSLTSGAATRTGSVVLEKVQTGYTGTLGYLRFNGEGQVSWPFTITTGTTYTSTLRYSLVGTDRPVAFLVDGVQKGIVNFPATANLNTWANARLSVTLSLSAGNHTLTLKTLGSGGPNIDTVGIGAVSGQTAAPVGTLYFVHNDHQGTPQVVTNKTKGVAWMADYQPFGKLQPGQANSIELYSRFPGQYVDSETGLYYNYFRDYDPSIGRYIQSDPIGLRGGINTYAYAEGNPLKYIDPMGLVAEEMCKKGVDQFCKEMKRQCRSQCAMATFSTMCEGCDELESQWKKDWEKKCESEPKPEPPKEYCEFYDYKDWLGRPKVGIKCTPIAKG